MQETIVLYPAPGMGHIVSMVELGKLILQHCNHHFSISIFLTSGFWDTPSVVSYVESTSRANPSISFHRFPSLFVDTSPTRSPAAICFEFIRLHDPSVLFSLQDLSKSCKIRAFVIDIFCTSALSIGRKLEIPTFYFYTSGATALAAFLQFPRIYEASPQSFQDLTTTVFHFQGISTSVKATEMPEPTLDRKDPACASFMHFCSSLPTSDGIIINTFEDLEPMAIKAIADGVCVDDGPTPLTYCIGPLIAGGKGQHDCLSWLDRQPSKSVIFLCFGSRGSLTPAQLTEIANALEKGGQRFLWVVKKPPEDEKRKQTEVDDSGVDLGSLLPEGFLEKTKDKGLVVESWAPQIAVLNHDSVGGFVTHCGWNSVLEAVVAGVPMIAWPLYAEQHLNRNILVHNMGMAIPFKQGEEGFVTAAEFEKRVRELMESDTGRKLKERSSKMKHKASAAFEERGSSTKALTKLIQVWKMGLH